METLTTPQNYHRRFAHPSREHLLREFIPEWSFRLASAIPIGLAVIGIVVDAGWATPFVWFYWVGLFLALSALLLIVIDIVTYKPLLFALLENARSPKKFFEQLRKVSDSIDGVLTEIEAAPPDSYGTLKELEENVLSETNNYCLLDTLRLRVTCCMLGKVLSMLLALSTVSYCCTHVVPGGLIVSRLHPETDVVSHAYFVVATFFTIGYGDLVPTRPYGYAFVGLCAALLVLTTYFMFAFLISSFSEFKSDVRQATHSYLATLGGF
jgi:hypothetical protein